MLHQETTSPPTEKEKEFKIPNSLLCPITHQILKHPVTLFPSGIVIEQQAADKIIVNDPVCPITRKPIKAYSKAYKVEEMIEEFLKEYPIAKNEQYVPEAPFTEVIEKEVNHDKPMEMTSEIKNRGVSGAAQRNTLAPQDLSMIFGFLPTELKPQSHPRQRPPAPTPPPSPQPRSPQPLPLEIKPLDHAEKENLRKELLDDVQNLIWALRFESGPKPRGTIQNFSLLFLALVESAMSEPLAWQKIEVAEGPKNESMYQILKAATRALKHLDLSILENSKNQYRHQYDQVKPKIGPVRSLSDSKYAKFAKTIGSISNQPGSLVFNMINKVEKQLRTLCQLETPVITQHRSF